MSRKHSVLSQATLATYLAQGVGWPTVRSVPPCRWWRLLPEAACQPCLLQAGKANRSDAGQLPRSYCSRQSGHTSSHTFSATVQEFAEKSVSMKVVQLQMRSLLRSTGEDLHTVSLDWWIRLMQGQSFTLPRIWHHKFFKLYILIVLLFSQGCLLSVCSGF